MQDDSKHFLHNEFSLVTQVPREASQDWLEKCSFWSLKACSENFVLNNIGIGVFITRQILQIVSFVVRDSVRAHFYDNIISFIVVQLTTQRQRESYRDIHTQN